MEEKTQLTTDETQTTVEEAFSHFFGTAKDVIAKYSHCAVCGANLHFSHVTNFVTNLTQETAKCPECGFKVHQVLHRLQ
ncbi:MAG TPA: hypothetical protein VJB59_14135 [Bdellovibrionota bacterium]|nr:hypothetical protein [Bdellovibrionota bacterium]